MLCEYCQRPIYTDDTGWLYWLDKGMHPAHKECFEIYEEVETYA